MKTIDKDALERSTSLEEYIAAGGDPHSRKNQDILGKLVSREVFYCASMLVSHFARNPHSLDGSDYRWEVDVLPLCESRPDPSNWTMKKCKKFLDDSGMSYPGDPDPWEMTRRELIETGYAGIGIDSFQDYSHLTDEEVRQNVIQAMNDGDMEGLEYWRGAVEDADPDEVYEHWIVSDWLAGKLKGKGEPTGELFNLTLWGRGCSGQAIKLDSVICEIGTEMQILEGQKYDWSKPPILSRQRSIQDE